VNPAAATPHPGSGGTTSAEATSQTQHLIRVAHCLLDSLDLTMSPSKISRLVRRYQTHVQPAADGVRPGRWRRGWSFLEFFGTACQLTAEQHRRALANPELAYLLCYRDPTGETAARNVDHERTAPATR
jgi:hypothetical protein